MRKYIFFLIPLIITTVFLAVAFYSARNSGKGALQVTSIPDSAVFINGERVGRTPMCKCDSQTMLSSGEYTIRLVPDDKTLGPFENKIAISKSVLTVVDRSFGTGATSDGSIVTLRPLSSNDELELFIASFPEKATVFLDKNPSGETPILLKNISASDHEIKLKKNGYREKVIRIRTVSGYRLTATVFLGIEEVSLNLQPTTASVSATTSISKVIILDTPVGFLRVRSDASTTASESGRLSPGQQFELLEEKEGWYKIKLLDGTSGWVSAEYARKE